MKAIEGFKEYFTPLTRLRYIKAILEWDQQVNMPQGSVNGRSEQLALIEETYHKKLISRETGLLIEKAGKEQNFNLIESALLREMKTEYDKAIKIPIELAVEIERTASLGHNAWELARERKDFKIFKPYLEKMVDLKRQYAEKVSIGNTLYDSLLDIYEPGATSAWITKIFNALKPKLKIILEKITNSSYKPDQSILEKNYNPAKQWDFSIEILKKLNFNFNIGRQDKSVHPFTTSLSSMDTRITTRIWENFLPACLFGTIHECGHALYEMGFKKEIHDTFLADGSSLGFHESMSRLWENIVGRSREFWNYWYPLLQKFYPENLKEYPEDMFYNAINSVQPSFIRVEADEITYGLHIILRFELEQDLINNGISITDLPELWNSKMEDLLGITPPDDAKGVLQDVHWSGGLFGYFPTYTLGNLYASQIYAMVLKRNPTLPEDFKKGNFTNLFNFLQNEIYQYGKIYQPLELLKRITREELNINYFSNYLEKKFYPIYKI